MTLPAELRLFRDRAHAVEVLRLVVAGLSEHEVTLWIDPHSDETLSGAAVAAQSHLEQRMSETKGQVTWW